MSSKRKSVHESSGGDRAAAKRVKSNRPVVGMESSGSEHSADVLVESSDSEHSADVLAESSGSEHSADVLAAFMRTLSLNCCTEEERDELDFRGVNKKLMWKRFAISKQCGKCFHGTLFSRLAGIKESNWTLRRFGYRRTSKDEENDVYIADWQTALRYAGLEWATAVGQTHIVVLEVTPSSKRVHTKGRNGEPRIWLGRDVRVDAVLIREDSETQTLRGCDRYTLQPSDIPPKLQPKAKMKSCYGSGRAASSSDSFPKAKKSKTTDSMDSGVLQPTDFQVRIIFADAGCITSRLEKSLSSSSPASVPIIIVTPHRHDFEFVIALKVKAILAQAFSRHFALS